MKRKQKTPAKKIDYKDLLYSYKLFQDLMEHIPDTIYFKDKRGRLILVNRAHAKGLGLEPGEVVGKTDFSIFPKNRAEKMDKDDKYVLSTGKPIIDKIERHTRADGVDNYVSTTKIPRFDDEGNIVGLIGITRDITHRVHLQNLREEKDKIKKKVELLEELDKAKSDFISTVSHELRTPLSIVKEAIGLVFDGIKGPLNKVQRQILTKAKINVERLKNIIEELLDISRIERGKFRLCYSLVNLNELAKDSADFFIKLAEDKGLSLDYKLPGEQVNIFMDPEKINRVISNLINNAVKFTEQGGKIEIEVKVFKDTVRVGVRDTGIGISKQDLLRVFDKFLQASGGKNKGVGLVLSIAKELVGRHGGEIWAESGPGIGSRFYFTLPRFYTADILDEGIREKINTLLNQDASLYLMDISIINYREFKKNISSGSRKLIKGLEKIIDAALNEFALISNKKFKIFLTDFEQSGCSIIFPGATEKETTGLCELFENKIKGYFVENKIDNTFVNIGHLDFSYKAEPIIYIKKVNIGIEKRRFRRIKYNLDIEPLLPEEKLESLYHILDISEGGIGLVTQECLRPDTRLMIRLNLPSRDDPLSINTRVAWAKEIEEPRKKGPRKYKTGLEFVGLSRESERVISKFILDNLPIDLLG